MPGLRAMTKPNVATEVDDLFDAALSKKAQRNIHTQSSAETAVSASRKSTKTKAAMQSPQTAAVEEVADVRGDRKQARPLTEDGLPIYSWQEMGMGQGGDTPECPFDCNCCF